MVDFSKQKYLPLLGIEAEVIIDRKKGCRQHRSGNSFCMVQYGNMKGFSSDSVYVLSNAEIPDTFSGIVIAVAINKISGSLKIVTAPSDSEFYEPYIANALAFQEKVNETDYICLYEKNCGGVIYTIKEGVPYFLLIENADSGHIGFPKGHVELGEMEKQTAVREIFEETALKLFLKQNFRSEYRYTLNGHIKKRCVYFLAEFSENANPVIQESEVSKSWLLNYHDAVRILNYPQDKIVLIQAYDRLRKELALIDEKRACSAGV